MQRVTAAITLLTVLSGIADYALAQAPSGLPDPSRKGVCDSAPSSPGQNAPGQRHGNGDGDWKDICACSTECSDGAWGSGGGGGVDPITLEPNGLVMTDPPPDADPAPPIICDFGDADSGPVCVAENFIPDPRVFNGSNPGYQGWGWFQKSRPELVVDNEDNPTKVRIYVGMGKVRDFSLVEGSSPNVFVGNNGVNGTVVRVAGSEDYPYTPELYRFYDAHGNIFTFFGYSTNSGAWTDAHGASGQLWTAVNEDGDGSLMYTGHSSNAVTALATGFILDGSSNPTARPYVSYDSSGRRTTYSYTSVNSWPLLSSVTIATYASSTWTTVWNVDYTYYTTDVSGQGLKGDLKYVTETRPLSSGGNEVRTTYMRYYTDSATNNDLRHLIKFKVDPEGVRRATLGALDSMSDASLKAYSSFYYEYNSAGQVVSLLTGAGCGCGGSDGLYQFEWDSQTATGTYTAGGTTGTGDWGPSRWQRRTTVTNPNGTKLALYFDEMGWILARVFTDAKGTTSSFFDASDGNTLWITKYERDGYGRPIAEYTPESVKPSLYDHSTGSITVEATSGLVRVTEYYTPSSGNNYLPTAVTAIKARSGETGSTVTLQEFEYLDPTSTAGRTFGSTNPARLGRKLPASSLVHRESGVSDERTFSYTFHSGSSTWAPKQCTVTLSALQSGDTSGPSSVTKVKYFDPRGRTVFSKDGNGFYTYTSFALSGQVAKRVQDASSHSSTGDVDAIAAASSFSITLPSTGFDYVTSHSYDSQGRSLTVTLPSGRVSANYYTSLSDGRLVTLATPLLSGGNATGPVSYSVHNHASKVEASGTLALTTSTAISSLINTSSADLIGAVQNSTVARVTVNVYNSHGTRLDESWLFNTIPSTLAGATSGQYEKTTFKYDENGRLRRTVDPTGTITYDIHDARGRHVERRIGTNDTGLAGSGMSGTNNMAVVSVVEYDNLGSGNGNLTTRRQPVDSTSGNDRITTYTYNYRGQMVAQTNPLPPHQSIKRDLTGRELAIGHYIAAPGVIDPTTTATNRRDLTETEYNSRGQIREIIRHKVNQTSGASEDTISESAWYDANGQLIKVQGEQLTKTAYDSLGRTIKQFVVAADNDSTYSDAATVSGDTVVEEYQSLYDNTAYTGNLLMSVKISRHPKDTSTTGALDAVADSIDVVAVGNGSFKGRASISSYYYDNLDRRVASVELGTFGGSPYTRSSDSSAGSSSPTRLVTSTTFGTDGLVLSNTDPMGIVARNEHDAAGRRTKSIANYVDGTPGGGSNGDQDQVTQYGYVNGLLSTLTAKMPSSSDDQITTYTYGVVQTGTLPSTITSNRLLREVTYPDSTGSSDSVIYAFNRQGEPNGTIDQAANQIDTAYDSLGREVARTVSSLASGFDGSVRRIALAYLSRGPISTVTQYDASSGGNVTDQVKYEYDAWGNLEHFRQDVDSAMDSSGDSLSGREAFDVAYTFAKNAPTGGVHTTRKTGMSYKADGTTFQTVAYTYGSGSSLNDTLSRVATVTVGSSPTTVATYDYLGDGYLVGTTLNQANLNTSVFTESSGTHTYNDIDLFSRPLRWNWERIGGASGGFYNVAINYDKNSNPTSTVDDVHIRQSSGKHLFDVVYTLDGLNRVIGADEGHATGTPLAIQSSYHTRNELWNNLTLTGNWKNRQLDANGDGDFTDESDRNEPSADQTFNLANEWTARKVTKTGTDNDSFAYTYDAVGNLTGDTLTSVRGMSTAYSTRGFVYDAFGRMVAVSGLVTEEGPVNIQQSRYNGLGFRIMWQYHVNFDGVLSNSERYYFMYDESWREIATFRNQDASPKEALVYHEAGSGGSGDASYIDSVILRDRDANGGGGWAGEADGTLEERRYYCQNWRADLVAITKSDGTPLEYVRYSSYGEPTVYPVADLDMNGKVESADSTEWTALSGGTGTTSAFTPDLNFDGTEDSADSTLFNDSYTANSGLSGVGRLSSPAVANRIGYAGYKWDAAVRLYNVRFRWYFPEIGRWGRRDPLTYVDGPNLYEYLSDSPIRSVDPTGLFDPSAPLPKIVPPMRPNVADDPQGPTYDEGLRSLLSGYGIAVKLATQCCQGAALDTAASEAKKLIEGLVDAWAINYGKGPHITHSDPVGGYLCWDWAHVFNKTILSRNLTQFSPTIGEIIKDPNATVSKVHFYVTMQVCNNPKPACTLSFDDGYWKSRKLVFPGDYPLYPGPSGPRQERDWTPLAPGTLKPVVVLPTVPPLRPEPKPKPKDFPLLPVLPHPRILR